MSSNDKLNHCEKTFKDVLGSISKSSLSLRDICNCQAENSILYFNVPTIICTQRLNTHSFFRCPIEKHTWNSQAPSPSPKWFFILGNCGYVNVMSVISILWPICKSEGASKIFHSMNYIFLCCLPCKFCKCHKSPEPDRPVWSMPNKQKSFQDPEHDSNHHQMTCTSSIA